MICDILYTQEETLEMWMKTIDQQPFAMADEPLHLMNIVTGLVSRAQLIEWGEFIERLNLNIHLNIETFL